jgi:hypothetical protein
MENEKAERFKRVAAPRVQRVLDSMDNLAKCSNRNNYEFTSEEVNKMLRAIKTKLKGLEQRFTQKNGAGKHDRFTF